MRAARRREVHRERDQEGHLWGLFFDDGTLALVILIVLLAMGFARHAQWIDELGAICIVVARTIAHYSRMCFALPAASAMIKRYQFS